ncbi:hypothetical protein [Actinokineospora cianjurensis]|uniref:Lipoprotein n=1 Tax=Actinokineospora cianjurensis TaxID=585224 RepID=A0A421B7C4_9PSEU|nr:hypothetical protein [Actinokineospora cianjurensis]RLK60123.1 hypothetical protein CLV68_0620 [Actinokineospora cianjurensis]
MSGKSLPHRVLLISAAAGFLLAGCTGEQEPAATPSRTAAVTSAPATTTVEPGPAPTQAAVPTTQPKPTAVGSTPTRPQPQAKRGPVIGPDGYGTLKLGMSQREAVATGRILSEPVGGGSPECRAHDAPGQVEGAGAVGISDQYGVSIIFGYGGAHTPEGIGVGSTSAEVKRAYPDLKQGWPESHQVTAVPGHSGNRYDFAVVDGKVVQFSLRNQHEVCVS